jgi:hypothetical protein
MPLARTAPTPWTGATKAEPTVSSGQEGLAKLVERTFLRSGTSTQPDGYVPGSRQMPLWPETPPQESEPKRLLLAIHRPALVNVMSSALASDIW